MVTRTIAFYSTQGLQNFLRLLPRADSALCFKIFLFTKRGYSLPCGEIAFDEKLYIKVLVSPYFDKKVSNPLRTKCPMKLFWHRWMYFSTWTISRKWFLCLDPSFWLSNSLKLDFVQTGLSLNQTLTTPDTILCPGYCPYRLQNVWPCRASNAQPNFSLIPHMEFLLIIFMSMKGLISEYDLAEYSHNSWV